MSEEWMPKPGREHVVNEADKPRYLTMEEIDWIIRHYPIPMSCDGTASEVTRKQVTKWLRSQLIELKICISAVTDYIEFMLDAHKRSVIATNTPVGTPTAQGIGATPTQMTLNTFHNAGSVASATATIEAIKELLFA